MRTIVLATAAAAAVLVVRMLPTEARERHFRASPSGAEAPPPAVSRFYPEEIEGGVKGNLPFNNQIRKLKDPLNANGAK